MFQRPTTVFSHLLVLCAAPFKCSGQLRPAISCHTQSPGSHLRDNCFSADSAKSCATFVCMRSVGYFGNCLHSKLECCCGGGCGRKFILFAAKIKTICSCKVLRSNKDFAKHFQQRGRQQSSHRTRKHLSFSRFDAKQTRLAKKKLSRC